MTDEAAPDEGGETFDAMPEAVVETVEPMSLTDDGMYRLDEDGDPMSGADLRKSYLRHRDYTKKTQELAQQRQQLTQREQQIQQQAEQYAQRVQQYYAQQNQPQRQQAADPLAEIWQRAEANGGIITTAEAKALVEAIDGRLGQANPQIVQALQMMHNRMDQMQQPIGEYQADKQERALTKKLDKFFDDNEVPAGAVRDKWSKLLKEWEPDANDRQMGKSHEDVWGELFMDLIKSAPEVTKQQAAGAVKKLGRAGGAVSPSNPLRQPRTVEEIVEATWRDT